MKHSKNTESQTTSQDSQTKKHQRLSAAFLTEEEMQKLREDSAKASAYAVGKFRKIQFPTSKFPTA